MKKIAKLLLAFMLVAGAVFALGPRVDYDAPYTTSTIDLSLEVDDVVAYVRKREQTIPNLKPDNEAQVVWADSANQSTKHVLLYLHGYSASHEEGAPLHEMIAERYGMNLYLSRLIDHGRLDSNTFKGISPQDFVESAWQELAIAQSLGDKVIVMSCSTGSTLSAWMAAMEPTSIHSQIMYSPNIDVYDRTSELLLYPWADQMLDLVIGSDYRTIDYPPAAQKYWTPVYHTDGIMALKHLLDETMTTEVFEAIKQPLFMGYYYKDEDNQDKVVSVDAMQDFYDAVGTPDSIKRKVAFPDAGHHVISSHIMSQDLDGVYQATTAFIDEVLQIKPKK